MIFLGGFYLLIGVYKDIHPFNTMLQSRIDAYLAEAKKQEVLLVFFGLENIDLQNKKINGDLNINGKWVKKQVDFPVIMINEDASRVETARDIEKEMNLKKYIPCTTKLIENKLKIHERIASENTLNEYIIPSEKVQSILTFKKLLSKYQKVVLKPVDGSRGNGIFVVTLTKKNIFLIEENKQIVKYDFKKLSDLIGKIVKKGNYIVQPFIYCNTKEGNPFDFRVHVMRDGQAEWVLVRMLSRTGALGTSLSNVSLGGKSELAKDFLKRNFEDQGEYYYNKLEVIALELARQIDSFYPYPLDELGIDLCIDNTGDIWFYEANTSPQVISYNTERAVNTIGYAKFLGNIMLKQNEK